MDSNRRYLEDKLTFETDFVACITGKSGLELRLQCFDHDGPKADLARDHNMHGNRRIALAGELELVESAPLPCRVALPIILVISLAAWRSLCPLPINHGLRSCIRRKEAAPEAKKPLQAAAIAALSRRRGSKSVRADEV